MTKGKTVNLKGLKGKKEDVTDKKNIENVEKKITAEKELKYQYPDDIDTLPLRKSFRRKARATRDSYMKKIAKAEKPAEVKKLVSEDNAWAKAIFTKDHMPNFS